MSFFQKAGSFTVNTSTGNQSITNVGFTPKFIIFYPTANTGTARIADCHNNVGFTDGTESFILNSSSEDAQGTTDTVRNLDNTHSFQCNTEGGAPVKYSATHVSFDSDGFTFNLDTANGNAYYVHYQAFGGSDILDVDVGNFLIQAATGDQSVTGVGFEPDFMFFGSMSHTSLNTDQQHNLWMWGFTDGTNDANYSHSSTNGVATSDCNRFQTDAACIRGLTSTGGIDYEATLKTFDADGFTIDVTNGAFAPKYVMYIAIKSNVRWKVGSFNMPTSTGNDSIDSIGFKPSCGAFSSHYELANNSLSRTDIKNSFGIVDTFGNEYCYGGTDDNGQATSVSKQWRADTVIQGYFAGGGVDVEASFVSWDTDGFTFNYSNAGSALQVIYWVAAPRRRLIIS